MVNCYFLFDVSQPVIWKKKNMFIINLKVLTDLNVSFFLLWSFEWFVDCHKNVLNPFLSRTAVWVFIIILLEFCWSENISVISLIVTPLHPPFPSVTISSSLALSCQLHEADINNLRASLMPPKVTGGLTPAHYKDRNQFGDSIMPIFYPPLSR